MQKSCKKQLVKINHRLRWTRKLFIKHKSLPEQITFFITNKCNLRCQHCFFWKELNKAVKELTLKEIERISKTMGRFAFLSLTGGEPFLRKDIAEIATIFCQNNSISRLSIPTNGTLSQEIISSSKQILEKNKNLNLVVKISLDGLEKEHDKIRNSKGCFKKAIKSYYQLRKLKKDYPNLKLGVLMTFSSLNQDKIEKLYDFIRSELKPDHLGLNLIRGAPKDKAIKKVNLSYYKKLYQRILNDCSQKRFFHLYKKKVFELLIKMVEEKKFQTDCHAGALSAVIYNNGDVFPCESLNKKIGSLRKNNYDFKKLWFNKKANEIRKHIRESKCFCRHECNLPLNIFFNPKSYPELLKGLVKGKQ